MATETRPMSPWIKGHYCRWGEIADPQCSFCRVKRSEINGFCPGFGKAALKRSASAAGFVLAWTVYASIVAWFLIGIGFVIASAAEGRWSFDWKVAGTVWGAIILLCMAERLKDAIE